MNTSKHLRTCRSDSTFPGGTGSLPFKMIAGNLPPALDEHKEGLNAKGGLSNGSISFKFLRSTGDAGHPSYPSASCTNPAHSRCTEQARQRACGSKTVHNELKKHVYTHGDKQHHRAHTARPANYPGIYRSPASRHSRCSAQTRASRLAGAERTKTHSRSTRNTPRNLAASRGEAAERQR